jgi:hypothetical protein
VAVNPGVAMTLLFVFVLDESFLVLFDKRTRLPRAIRRRAG